MASLVNAHGQHTFRSNCPMAGKFVHSMLTQWSSITIKVKFSHTRYRALGPEQIPVYRQLAGRRREVNHAIDPAVGCRLLSARPTVTPVAFTRWRYLLTATHN